MRVAGVPKHEKAFRESGVDSNGKKHVLSPFVAKTAGSGDPVSMVSCKVESGEESFYFKEATPKQRIVLHFTAGYLKSDIATLTTPENHASTPFVVARDGTIYNLWDSKYWSYHLGPRAQGGNTEMSKSSIGIEISNIGWLRRFRDNLVTYFSNDDVYCAPDETRLASQVTPFRGQSWFASYPNEQYEAVIRLVRYLAAKYDIPRAFVQPAHWYDVVPTVNMFHGITSHVNYRSDGKWDIGPAFDWERVMAAVQA